MIAPPGTPGAAIIVTPSSRMNPAKVPAGISSPPSIETANAQATIFIIDPERWIVAQSGTTNDASWGRTPSRRVCARVTGMVAADDCVPSAVT